jgi:alanine racemase
LIPYDIWAEIDLAAVSHNIASLKALSKSNVRLMAVVKADAYGHGAVRVARQALAAGADCLAVARLGEAVELRHAGIAAQILIFGHTRPEMAGKLIAYDLLQTVSSYADASALGIMSEAAGRPLRVHVKVDTGMGRLGISGSMYGGQSRFSGAADEIEAICKLPGICAEGIYTHFATADSDDPSGVKKQLEIFEDIIDRLKFRGVNFLVRHAANSAAAIRFPETRFDMIRPGISIYGCHPWQKAAGETLSLKPAMSLRARIVHLKTVGPGFKVSYGWTGQTRMKTIIATVPVGYADGFSRRFSSSGIMQVRGYQVPVIGRVCMDHTMLDVGSVPEVSCGDTALVFGRDEYGQLSVSRLADMLGTIDYEVLSGISSRIPRIYI